MQITNEVYQGMVEHARQDFPLECCGLLAGKAGRVSRRIPCTNQLRSSTAFQMPPEELFDNFRTIRRLGLKLGGIYHSHPYGQSWPSLRDEAEFFYPEISYWIVSLGLGGATVSCFLWDNKAFCKVPFRVIRCCRLTSHADGDHRTGKELP